MSATFAEAGVAPDHRRSDRKRTFAGFTWKGLALVVLICALNGIRRKIQVSEPLPLWLMDTARLTLTGLVFALPIMLAVVATYNHVYARRWRRYAALGVAVLLSSIAGITMVLALEQRVLFGPLALEFGPEALLAFIQNWLRYALVAALFTAVYVYLRVAEESSTQAREAELDRERLDQQMDEARLQVLEAQIEPHFLFNTLATIRRLYHTTPGSAVAMLDDLIRYLALALPQIRSSESTLGREAELAESYLRIQQIRMGRRLAFEIDVPPTLRDARMPPMMLLTLIENAIRHGLNPLPEGGFIRIAARLDRGQIRLEVADSGRGFVRSSGAGTGLANIRSRLSAGFGPRARLVLGLNRPRGITATIVVPHPLPEASVTSS